MPIFLVEADSIAIFCLVLFLLRAWMTTSQMMDIDHRQFIASVQFILLRVQRL